MWRGSGGTPWKQQHQGCKWDPGQRQGLQPQTRAVSMLGLCVRVLLCPAFAPIGIYSIYKCINGSHLKIHPEIELAMGFFFPFNKDEGFI